MRHGRQPTVRHSKIWSRTRSRAAATCLVAALLAGCTASGHSADVTVTRNVTVSNGSSAASTSTGTSTGSSASSPATSSAGQSSSSSAPTSKPPTTTSPGRGPGDGPVQPDGFVPRKMKPGEKAPQFVIVSFDGVGYHDRWQYWFGIMQKVPFHFTGFLSGTYMLSKDTATKYKGPGHKAGKSSIGWGDPSDIPVEIGDLNKSLALGNEVGTHFVGHFCGDNPPGAFDWKTNNWNDELDQFFGLVANVDANNGISTKLNLTRDEIKGERTPCLEGYSTDLFPALQAHQMTYDSSFTNHGISWPTQDAATRIWQAGMAEFPIHGTLPATSPVDADKRTNHVQITMDYNFYYSQRSANSDGATPADSAANSDQVLKTYQDMYNATYNGNRAPLILGNHFEDWNNSAYSNAIGNFALQTCGKPDTYCVPFRDLFAWIAVQDPARMKDLQNQAAEVAAP